MKIASTVPFIKLVNRPNSSVFRVKKVSPCVVSRADNTLFMDNNGKWVESIMLAKIATFSEMYNEVKDFDYSNELVFLFIKI